MEKSLSLSIVLEKEGGIIPEFFKIFFSEDKNVLLNALFTGVIWSFLHLQKNPPKELGILLCGDKTHLGRICGGQNDWVDYYCRVGYHILQGSFGMISMNAFALAFNIVRQKWLLPILNTCILIYFGVSSPPFSKIKTLLSWK